jgi:hypothetical protein
VLTYQTATKIGGIKIHKQQMVILDNIAVMTVILSLNHHLPSIYKALGWTLSTLKNIALLEVVQV